MVRSHNPRVAGSNPNPTLTFLASHSSAFATVQPIVNGNLANAKVIVIVESARRAALTPMWLP